MKGARSPIPHGTYSLVANLLKPSQQHKPSSFYNALYYSPLILSRRPWVCQHLTYTRQHTWEAPFLSKGTRVFNLPGPGFPSCIPNTYQAVTQSLG